MRASKPVMARVDLAGRAIQATFDPSTGHLRITEGAKILHALAPPDSWLALASISQASGFGTRPSQGDLDAYLQGYVQAHLVQQPT
jgi:hypothetical protein